MILSGQTIISSGIVTPCETRTVQNGLTYGVGAASYDVRVEFHKEAIVRCMLLDPDDFVLVSTIEYFEMPDDVLGIVHDKSTWIRKGLAVQNTVLDPGWRGYLTLELTNHGRDRLELRHGDPIAQIVFHELDERTMFPYDGKYQEQERGPVESRDE